MQADKGDKPSPGKPARGPREKAPADPGKAAERVKTDPPDFHGEKEPNPGHPV